VTTPADLVLVQPQRRLDADQARDVLALIAAAADADGTSPVSEHVLLHLRHGGDRDTVSLLGYLGSTLVGYAHLDSTDLVAGSSAELVVHPGHRRRRVGGALVAALQRASPDGRLRLWAHGRHADAAALARRHGYVQERVLWQLRRSLLSQLPEAALPPGVGLRPFVVGADEAAWVGVNNRAFASHPDQGGWTLADIQVREAEPWFDPAGFLLAHRLADGDLIGFHWTKVHGGQVGQTGAGANPAGGRSADPTAADGNTAGRPAGGGPADHASIGEVYVLGVDPAAQGLRLGPALTVAGLRYLRNRGLAQVMLYVDETNQPALRLYERLGFTRWDVDVQYRRDRPVPA
jgi:mycothiol synthase